VLAQAGGAARGWGRIAPAVAGACLVAGVSGEARADVSSWLFVGTGPTVLKQEDQGAEGRWSLQVESGLGTPPGDSLIVGGIGRLHTHFGEGADLALLVRTAMPGFVNGSWGGALDLGGYQRFWGIESTGGAGSLVLGAPWGITLSLGAMVGTNEARTFSASLGIDFARLTVYRLAGQSLWVNPFPPGRSEGNGMP
jgi:hypothetical protein